MINKWGGYIIIATSYIEKECDIVDRLLKDVIDGIKIYVDSKIANTNIIATEIATIISHSSSGYKIKLNGKEYNNILTLNSMTFTNGESVRLLCKKTGDKYIEILILGKVTS